MLSYQTSVCLEVHGYSEQAILWGQGLGVRVLAMKNQIANQTDSDMQTGGQKHLYEGYGFRSYGPFTLETQNPMMLIIRDSGGLQVGQNKSRGFRGFTSGSE